MPMNPSTGERAADFYVETYDLAVSDWPGEITFYREMAAEARSKGGGVLEIGCGTGRVARRLHNWRELSICSITVKVTAHY